MSDELIKIAHNLPEVRKKLREIALRAGSLRPVFKVMAKTLALSTEKRFSAETGPDGEKWQGVKTATRRRKKNPKILTESTKLRDGIHEEISDDTLLFGSDSPYGAIHQLGGKFSVKRRGSKRGKRARKGPGKITMPARPFLGISVQDEADLLDDVGQYLMG